MELQNPIEQYFAQCDAINHELDPHIELIQKQKNKRLEEALDDFIESLKNLLPPKLLRKVEKDFNFNQEDDKKRHFLRELIKKCSCSSMGSTFLFNIRLKKKDINELNTCWEGMVNLDPKLKSFSVLPNDNQS